MPFFGKVNPEHLFDDELHWEVPEEEAAERFFSLKNLREIPSETIFDDKSNEEKN